MNCDSPFVVWLTAYNFWQVEIEDLKTRLPVWSLHSPLQVLASPLQTFRSCVFNWLTSLPPLSWQCQCQQGCQNPTQSLQWMRQMWTGRIHPGEASKGQGLWQTWNVSFKSWGLHAMGTYTSCHRMAPMYPSVCGKNKLVLLEKLWGAPLYCMKKSWCNGLIACKLGRAGVFLFAHVNCFKAALIVCLQVAIAMQLIQCGLSGSGSSIYTLGPKMLQQLQKNALSCHLWLPTRAIWFGSHNLALCSPSAWWHVPKRSCRWKNVCRIALHWLSVCSDFHFSCDLILLSLYTFFFLTLFRFVIIYYLFSVFVCSNSFSWIHTPRVPHFNLYFLVCASSALLFITVAQNSSFLLWWLHGSTLPRPHCVFEPLFVLMSSMHCSSASKGRQEK